MRIILESLLILFIISQVVFPQVNDRMITVIGDSLIGRVVDGQNIREVIGNVVMTQKDVRITCNRAIQFLTVNRAHLMGNVVITQDSMRILTEEGYYYGDDKIAFSDRDVYLDDGNVKLSASKGYYYTDEKRAYFIGNVKLVDAANILNSDRLTYFVDDENFDAAGNVLIFDKASSISADSLIYIKELESTYAFGNVIISDEENNFIIAGDELKDLKKEGYSKITGNPVFIQIDTANSGEVDTLVISSMIMEQKKDSINLFIATDSVKIMRGLFSSLNDKSLFFRNEDRILTIKQTDESRPPVLWYDNSQLVGDTVNIFLEKNRLKRIEVESNSSIISKGEGYEFRYDQMSGDKINIYFNGNGMERTEINGSVLSIYYLVEENESSGLIKSSAQNAVIYFDSSEVSDVRLYGSPVSEYHPENLVNGKEKEFTLPTFILYEGRPNKDAVLRNKNYYK